MSDPVDLAQAREEELRQDALAAQVLRSMAPGKSALNCEDCGTPIPLERRTALPGVQTCVDCQSLKELTASRPGRTA